jgi:hypothetical protein
MTDFFNEGEATSSTRASLPVYGWSCHRSSSALTTSVRPSALLALARIYPSSQQGQKRQVAWWFSVIEATTDAVQACHREFCKELGGVGPHQAISAGVARLFRLLSRSRPRLVSQGGRSRSLKLEGHQGAEKSGSRDCLPRSQRGQYQYHQLVPETIQA